MVSSLCRRGHRRPPGVASAATDDNPPVLLEDGVTALQYDYPDAITDIIRPRELDATAKVPVIMDASPYHLSSGRGNEAGRKEYDADGVRTRFRHYYDNYFVPRGYAFVAVDTAAGDARRLRRDGPDPQHR